jgi:hypothetical protein
MEDSLRRALEQERAKLYRELMKHPTFIRIDLIDALLRSGADEVQPETGSVTYRNTNFFRTLTPYSAGMEPSDPLSDDIRDTVYGILNSAKIPISVRMLLDDLIARGFRVPGNNPINNLSAQLSKDTRFISIPGSGWTLQSLLKFDEESIKNVATNFFDQLSDESSNTLVAQVQSATGGGIIPKEIDQDMLRFSGNAFGRRLTNEEKAAMRNKLAELARNSV